MNTCGANSTCTPTNTSHTCTCDAGYWSPNGDGKNCTGTYYFINFDYQSIGNDCNGGLFQLKFTQSACKYC